MIVWLLFVRMNFIVSFMIVIYFSAVINKILLFQKEIELVY